MHTTDFLIIGAGIVGLSLARQIQLCQPDATLTLIDKEPGPGKHASTRNSGVLHSGIYYTADSLKARFTRDGNSEWQDYCAARGIPVDRCGKLVVPRNRKELEQLAILEQRGADNGVEVQRLDEQQTREVEPRVSTYEYALFIPSTATIEPGELIESLKRDIQADGGQLFFDCPYQRLVAHRSSASSATDQPPSSPQSSMIQAGNQRIDAGCVINCAGLYADRIAHDFGFGRRYAMLPFKGLYLSADPNTSAPRSHIYPTPDLGTPFLGVHLTRTLKGGVKLGPTATPALWREHYTGLHRFSLRELLEIAGHEAYMLATNRNKSRTLARQELNKRRQEQLVAKATGLIEGIERMGFRRWGRPGIRAQLVDRQDRSLIMDFVVEGDAKSLHILNAVSPALTCALPFARYVVKDLLKIS